MVTLSPTQTANAKGIIAAVKARNWPSKAAVIAIETALTESGMKMIASANVPESQKYPYEPLSWTADGLGHDHASMGMFQQQTGYAWTPAGYGQAMNQTTMDSPNGWGTPAELMNAQTSTAKFLDALSKVNWQNMDNWLAAQAVQRSAFADGSNYKANDATAIAIVNQLWESEDDVTPADIQAIANAVWAHPHKSSNGISYTLESYCVMADVRANSANNKLDQALQLLAALKAEVDAIKAKEGA